MPTLLWDTRGSLLFIYSSDETLSDDEFERCCQTTERLGKEYSPVRVYVVAGKSPPTPAQRKRSSEMGKKVKVRCATIMSYVVTRAVVNIFSLFMDIKAFKPSDFDGAADYIQATPDERIWIKERLATFKAQMDGAAH